MIPRVYPRVSDVTEALAEALDRSVSDTDGLTGHTVVAYWTELGSYTQDDEQETWTSAQWAQHLHDPLLDARHAASPQGNRRAIFHASVRLHPDDRDLSGAEWAEVAHRLARAAGIQKPGDKVGCHWVAVQGQPGRLDLIANLIRGDGTRQHQSPQLPRRLMEEARRIEAELGLISPRTSPDPQQAIQQARFAQRATRQTGTADSTAQLAALLRQLAAERTGPLSTVRGLVEQAAHRLDHLPGPDGPDGAHQLELIARRLYGIQQDLDTTAAGLLAVTPPDRARRTPHAMRADAAPASPGSGLAR
ncbi:hypothetical protein ACWDBF_07895 [Streptomyces angustmyceticus]